MVPIYFPSDMSWFIWFSKSSSLNFSFIFRAIVKFQQVFLGKNTDCRVAEDGITVGPFFWVDHDQTLDHGLQFPAVNIRDPVKMAPLDFLV